MTLLAFTLFALGWLPIAFTYRPLPGPHSKQG